MNRVYHRVYSRDAAAAALITSLILLLAAGLHNVAHGFADVKLGSSPLIHWGGALAVELGVVAIGLTIAVRARSGQSNRRLYLGIFLFVAASMFANYDASLQSLVGGRITWQRILGLDGWTLAKAALLGGALPVMVLLVIECLRELAKEVTSPEAPISPASPSPTVTIAPTETAPVRVSAKAHANGAGHHTPPPSPAAQRSVRNGRVALRQLVVDEPDVSPTDLARRLHIGRATVYRWRDELGLTRQDGRWIVP